MKSRTRHILRFLSVTAILATMAVLFVRGRDPSFLSLCRPSVGEAALERKIHELDIAGLPIDQAFTFVSQKADVPIVWKDGTFLPSGEPSVVFRARDISVAAVLDELCHREDGLYYFPTTNGLEVAVRFGGDDRWYLDVYDLRKTISCGPRPARQTKQEPDDLSLRATTRVDTEWAMISQFESWSIPESWSDVAPDSRCVVRYSDGWVFAPGSASAQRKIRQFAAGVGGIHRVFEPDELNGVGIACLFRGNWIPLQDCVYSKLPEEEITWRYDLSKYFRRFPPELWGTVARRVTETIRLQPKSNSGYDMTDGELLEFVGPYLVVRDTWESQQAVAARLRQFLKDQSSSSDLDIPDFVESATLQPVR